MSEYIRENLIPPELAPYDPQFTYITNDVMGLEIALELGKDREKATESAISFSTLNIGGYPMDIMVKGSMGGEWKGFVDIGAIAIRLNGQYEQDVLVAAIQKIALLSILVYGKQERGPFEPT